MCRRFTGVKTYGELEIEKKFRVRGRKGQKGLNRGRRWVVEINMVKEIWLIQLNPVLTDFRGPTVFFCYRRTSVIANKGNKRNQLEGTMNYSWNSVGGGSVRAVLY